jgi:hypothetical protein
MHETNFWRFMQQQRTGTFYDIINMNLGHENHKYVLRVKNKTKAMWHAINKEAGKSWNYDKKIELNDGT